MFFTNPARILGKLFLFFFGLLMVLQTACTKGVFSGSLSRRFAGVQEANILSPSQVQLKWLRSPDDIDYTVYMAGKADALKTLTFESYTVEGLTPNTEYKFKVVARTTEGTIGDDKEITITTWPRFSGLTKLTKDENGNFVLSWDYPYAVKAFQIYYLAEYAPSELNTNAWKNINALSTDQTYTVKDWKGAANYYFTVHAEYNSGEFERPNVFLSMQANPSFPVDAIEINIPTLTIGSLPIVSVTPHRDGVMNDYPLGNYSSQLFQGDKPISDPQTGISNLVVLPNANLNLGIVDDLNVRITYNDGSINQTLIKRSRPDGTPFSTVLKDQVKILETPPVDATQGGPGFMGKAVVTGDFNCDGVDDLAVGMPDSSIASLGQTAAFAGVVYIYYSRTVSCGTSCTKTELYTPAVGAPAPSVSPAIRGVDPQIIAISDLPVKSRFGASLSAGNINMDGSGNPWKECDDLVVGSPGMQANWSPTGTYTDAGPGSAFVFFGSSEGINAATSLTAIAENTGTCLGNYTGDSCAPVRIWPNSANYRNSDMPETSTTLPTFWGFGTSVSVVGDMTGDGYSEIAIGAPNTDYEGRVDNGSSVAPSVITDAGSVHLYFGSKRGLGFGQIKRVSSADNSYPFDCTSSSQKGCVRAIKIYSPLPQENQYFGYSLAGNVDIDGRNGPQSQIYKSATQRAAKCSYARPNLCYSTSDMVVGAPGGTLFLPSGSNPFKTYTVGTPSVRYVKPADSSAGSIVDLDWPGTVNWNSGVFSFGSDSFNPTGLGPTGSNKGLAFIYFGMTDNDVTSVDSSDVNMNDYYSCSNRYDAATLGAYSGAGGLPADLHFSCFTNGKNVRYLYVRDSSTGRFGRSVTALGGRHSKMYVTTDSNINNYAWTSVKDLDTLAYQTPYDAFAGFKEAPQDANGDYYGDVYVSAPYSQISSSKTYTGAVLGFFGNPMREFSTKALNDAYGTTPSSSSFYQTATPNCVSFDANDSGNPGSQKDRILCRPMLIKPNSLTSGGMLGYENTSMSKGDVDGDGLQDLIVGAPFDSSTGGADSGSVFIFTSDPARGIGTSSYKVSNTKPGLMGTRLGMSVAAGKFEDPANRVNGAGYPYVSVVAGAPNDYSGTGSTTKPGGGAVHLFKTNYASFAGGSTPTESLKDGLTSFQDLKYQSAKIVGDINNDGYEDAVAHTFYYNTQGERVYEAVVYFGARIGLISPEFCKQNLTRIFQSGGSEAECAPKTTRSASVKTLNGIRLPQKVSAPNGVINAWAYFAVGVGDVNKDGFDDVLFVNPFQTSAGKGNMVLYFGSAIGLNAVNSPSFTPVSVGDPQIITGGWVFNVPTENFYISENSIFDQNFVTYGDFNGDGYSDIVLSDYYSSPPALASNQNWNCTLKPLDLYCPQAAPNYYGRVFVLYGSVKGLYTPRLNNSLASDLFPFNPPAGSYVDANFYDPYQPIPGSYPNQGSERFDEQAAISGAYACDATYCKPTVIWNPINVFDYLSTGGTNGTYYNALPEAHQYINTSFGKSVTVGKITAGTSDDSAYDTLIVGAPDFIDLPCSATVANSTARSGRVFMYYGSAKGIRAFNRREYYDPNPANAGGCWASVSNSGNSIIENPASPQAGDDLKLHTRSVALGTPVRLLALQPPLPMSTTISTFSGAGRRFGDQVLVAGDMNGDGTEDLIVTNRYTTVSSANGQIRSYDGGTSTFYGQAWVYYGSMCSVDNDTQSWTNNDNPLSPKLSVAGTQAEFTGGLNGVPLRTLASTCFKNSMTKKFLPHTFTVLGGNTNEGDSFFSIIASGRNGRGNFNFDGIDNYSDLVVGSNNSNDNVSSTEALGNGYVFFGSDLGLITDELPQTFMAQKSSSTLLKPRYKPLKIIPIFKFPEARFFSGSVSIGDVNGDSAMDILIPSSSYSGTDTNKGVDLGAFMLFY